MVKGVAAKYLPNPKVSGLLSEEIFIYQFHKSSQKLRERFNQSLEKYGIISIQYAILFLLSKKQGMSQKEIGDELGIDKASMVKFLDGLEEENYILRKENDVDRRIKVVSLSTRGRKLFPILDRLRKKVEDDFLEEKLSAEEIKVMRVCMQKILLSERN